MDFCQVSYRCGLLKVGKYGLQGHGSVVVGKHYQPIVSIMFKNIIDKYLMKAGYTF